MTLEAWVYPTATLGQWRDVIYKGDDNYFLMARLLTPRPGDGGIFAGTYSESFAPRHHPAQRWTHLAATYDGTTLRLYVNGTLVTSKPQTGTLATSTNPLQIGGDTIYGQYFAGRIDEVRVYNTARTQPQDPNRHEHRNHRRG